MCFYIKALGDWTKQLRTEFEGRISGAITLPLDVEVRGPYGAPAQHVKGFQRVVLISGGVGATPFCSISKDLYNEMTRYSPRSPHNGGSGDISSMASDSATTLSPLQLETAHYINQVCEELHEAELGLDAGADNSPHSMARMVRNGDIESAMQPRIRKLFSNSEGGVSNPAAGVVKEIPHVAGVQATPRHRGIGMSMILKKGESIFSTDRRPEAAELSEDMNAMWATVHVRRCERMLTALHSVTASLATVLLLVARGVLWSLASIFLRAAAGELGRGMGTFRASLAGRVDAGLGLLVEGLVTGSVLCELGLYRRAYFRSKGRVVDLVGLLPLMVAWAVSDVCVVAGLQRYLLPDGVLFGLVVPMVVVLLVVRLHRTVGGRVLLADWYGRGGYGGLRAVDFVWTTPYGKDDDWLCEELGDRAGKHLRLHRFVTREKGDEEGGSGLTTCYG